MVVLKKIHRLSKNVEEYMNITEEVHRIVEESGVKNGHVAVLTAPCSWAVWRSWAQWAAPPPLLP